MKYFVSRRKTRILEHFKSNSYDLIIVLHGYGQLISHFSRKFDSVSEDINLLFVEGPHRYYLKGSSGRVGASWMTKEDREIDIEENHDLLDALVDNYKRDFRNIYVLGFSQGAATAARYVAQTKQAIKGLMLWGSVFPEDMQNQGFQLKSSLNILCIGEDDEYYNEERVNQEIEKMNSLQIPLEVIKYKGGHNIYALPLKKIIEKISD
jgi:predicted esterase